MNNFKLISVNGLQLEYLRFGTGAKILFCFHGFGRNAGDFLAFENSLASHYQIISVNLFHHGNSFFPEGRLANKPMTFDELSHFFNALRKQEKVERFSLMGYSLGGKVALTLAQLFTPELDALYLAAPDGIKANPWYYFASQTKLGQTLNKKSISNPWIFDWFMKGSSALGLANKKQARFAQSNMLSEQKRQQVYNIWMTHRKIKPKLEVLERQLKFHEVNTLVFVGKFEKVIPVVPVKNFVERLGEYGSYVELDSGHQINFEMLGELIKNRLNKK